MLGGSTAELVIQLGIVIQRPQGSSPALTVAGSVLGSPVQKN